MKHPYSKGPGIGSRQAILLLLPALIGAFMAADCSKPSSDFGSTGPDIVQDTSVAHDTARASDTLRFATLNMSIGFPVAQLVFTDMDDPAVAYVVLDSLFKRYQHGLPSERIKGMARAIKDLDLDVVGLQEVMAFNKDGVRINDYLEELVADIKQAGGPDYAVFGDPLNDTLLTGSLDGKSIEIAFHEGNALLVKPGIQVLDSADFIYFSLLPIQTTHGTTTQRSLQYLKLRGPHGVVWQVYNTHLEVFTDISSSQALELRKIVDSLKVRSADGGDSVPQIVMGDFNVDPNTNAHTVMTQGGFRDTYDAAPADPALHDISATCCVAESALWDTQAGFSERRLDYIFGRHLVAVLENRIALKGPVETSTGDSLFASDHRMVWTRIVGQ